MLLATGAGAHSALIRLFEVHAGFPALESSRNGHIASGRWGVQPLQILFMFVNSRHLSGIRFQFSRRLLRKCIGPCFKGLQGHASRPCEPTLFTPESGGKQQWLQFESYQEGRHHWRWHHGPRYVHELRSTPDTRSPGWMLKRRDAGKGFWSISPACTSVRRQERFMMPEAQARSWPHQKPPLRNYAAAAGMDLGGRSRI